MVVVTLVDPELLWMLGKVPAINGVFIVDYSRENEEVRVRVQKHMQPARLSRVKGNNVTNFLGINSQLEHLVQHLHFRRPKMNLHLSIPSNREIA